MGLTLEFVLGDPEIIRKAVAEEDLDRLEDSTVIKARADFSLHLTPHDLDLLSEEIAVVLDCGAVKLRPHLEVLFDERDRGVFLVDKFWVSYVAAIRPAALPTVAERWVARMRSEYHDPQIVLTEEIMKAVIDLANICTQAKTGGERLIHLWSL